MEIIKGMSLQGKSFSIDGKRLVDCTLVECTIEYAGGAVILERTVLRGCRYVFSGRAKMTIEFMDCVGLMTGESSSWGQEDCLVN